MKKTIIISVLALLVTGCSLTDRFLSPKETFSTEGKTVTVYTTASDTELRLAQTGEKVFAPADQPLESEVAVFVNPNKTFQTFWGIGAAITDASAEVFAKLPKDKQDEFLKSHFDVEDG
ncbi:MAG: glycosyl hydrolase, partial [Planctomycetota bacterium]